MEHTWKSHTNVYNIEIYFKSCKAANWVFLLPCLSAYAHPLVMLMVRYQCITLALVMSLPALVCSYSKNYSCAPTLLLLCLCFSPFCPWKYAYCTSQFIGEIKTVINASTFYRFTFLLYISIFQKIKQHIYRWKPSSSLQLVSAYAPPIISRPQ